MRDDNYPDNIRDFDHDPRSPFHEDPPEPKEEVVIEEISHWIDDDQTLYWSTIDDEDTGTAQWEWFCKMRDLAARKLPLKEKIAMEHALSVELFETLNKRVNDELWDQAKEELNND